MKFIKNMTKIVLSIVLVVPLFAMGMGPSPEPNFNLSEEEIRKLNLSESEAAELRQFFDALNNLSPAEKQELEELGKKTEAEMKKKNLDPTNFEDLVKFMESEGAVPKEPVRPAPPVMPVRKVEEPIIEQPKVVPVSSPVDTLTMLNDLIRHLASLHQKGITHESISRRLEPINSQLYELTYYLHLLKAPDLIVLLSSREFMPLHESLKNLHAALATYEPSIIGKRRSAFAEDNPYEVLGISSDAAEDDIKASYEKAKKALSPQVMEQRLKEQGADAKTIKKRIKEAHTTFMLIEDAYKALKDPQKRQKIDARLQERGALEIRHDTASMRAFENLYRVLSGFYPQAIIKDSQQLLERYKPQEAALARAQLEKERTAYERSKQVTRVSQLPPRISMPEAPYEEFYRKMAQESYQRPMYPGRPGAFPGMMPQQPPVAPTGAEGGAAKGKKEGKKEGGKKDEKGKEEKGKEEKGKERKEKTRGIEKKDIEKYSLIAEIEKILKSADELDKLAAQVPTRSKSEESFPTLKEAIANVDRELTTVSRGPSSEPNEDVQAFDLLMKKYGFEPLTQDMKKLAPGPNKKIDDANLKKEWQERIFNPYGYKIVNWYEQLYPLFTAEGRHTFNWRTKLQGAKTKVYNLASPTPDLWAKPAGKSGKPTPIPEPSEGEALDLGKWRNTIIAMQAYFDNINKAFGLGMPSKAPIKNPKSAPKEEKEEDDEDDEGEEKESKDQ